MATDTFHAFGNLPYELRHDIWDIHDPTGELICCHTAALADHILALPHDDAFWGTRTHWQKGDHDGKWILEFLDKESPYQGLSGCHESRILALKHVKKELEGQFFLKQWLEKPTYPYKPRLTLDKKVGTLTYGCPGVTEEYHLEQFVFWDKPQPALTTQMHWSRWSRWSDEEDEEQDAGAGTEGSEEENDEEWDIESGDIDAIPDDLIWSDDEDEEQDAGAGTKRGREDEDAEENAIDQLSPKRQKLGREKLEGKA